MKITRTAYSRVNKITQLYHVFIKGCFVSPTLILDECAVQKGCGIVQICIGLLIGMFSSVAV